MSDKPAPAVGIDARTFQKPLAELTETIALKVQREAVKTMTPVYVATDIYVMLRQVLKTYELFFYINSDERRSDPAWHMGYPAAMFPLVRNMIDCLYNITTLLENPQANGRFFRASGYKQMLEAIEEDEKRYGGSKQWHDHNAERRKIAEYDMRANGFPEPEVRASKQWTTLGKYLRDNPSALNAIFLKQLTLGFWREYSGMAHAAFHGLIPTAPFFSPRDIPVEQRAMFDTHAFMMLSMHLLRVVGILLCILTEVQAYFRFSDARINERLIEGWNAVLPALEVKELYDLRYATLMRDIGIETP
jgi:hypothetical protein